MMVPEHSYELVISWEQLHFLALAIYGGLLFLWHRRRERAEAQVPVPGEDHV